MSSKNVDVEENGRPRSIVFGHSADFPARFVWVGDELKIISHQASCVLIICMSVTINAKANERGEMKDENR